MFEDSSEGLQKLLGEYVTFYCMSYIYAGKLMGVNEYCVLLQDASIVYETGAATNKNWSIAEKLPNDWYISMSSIESFGIYKNA